MKRALLGVVLAIAGCAAPQPVTEAPVPPPEPAPAPAPAGPTVVEHDWLTQGQPSGTQRVEYHPDGRVVVDFAFNDRGRGPQLRQTLRIENGLVVSDTVSGKAYLGAPVDEQFAWTGGKATWRSTREQGEKLVAGPAMYVPTEITPESFATLARAALQQPDKRLPILPTGEVRIETLRTVEASNGAEKKPVTLYAVTGLDFVPSYVWLDADRQLFALDFGWMGLTPKGWAAALPALAKQQREAQREYFLDRSRALTEPLPGVTLIDNVHVLDVLAGKRSDKTAVAVHGGKIVAIGPGARKRDGIRTWIDGAGGTLLPGLWDMHAHLALEHGLLNIANGVTSVRDMANDHVLLSEFVEMYDRGEVVGPHVYRAGFIDQKSPYSAPTGALAESLEQAKGFVDWYAERGYPHIKIYSSIAPEWVKPLAAHAHGKGLRFSGHIPAGMKAEQAIQDGFDEIQHVNMLFLNFLAAPTDDTRTPLRFTLVADKGATLDLSSKPVRDFVALLKQRKVVVDPTVTIFRSMFLHKAGMIDPAYAEVADRFPSNVRRNLLGGGLDITPENEARYAESAKALLRFVKLLHDSGVPLVAGTDALPGFALQKELELYAEAGIPNADVLRIATINAARLVGMDKHTGSVTFGKDADLVLVTGDPLQRISDLRKVAWTMKGGRLYRSEALYAAVGIAAAAK